MKILVYSKERYSNINNITSIEYDPTYYNGSWVFYDNINNNKYILNCKSNSIFLNKILEYILYYQNNNNKIWSYFCYTNNNVIIIDIYLDINLLEKKLLKNKLKKKHNYLLFLLAYTYQKNNIFDIYDFTELWKEAHIPNNNFAIQPFNNLSLYNYQLKTLQWMINLENNNEFNYIINTSLLNILDHLIPYDQKNLLNDTLSKIKIDLIKKDLYIKKNNNYKMNFKGGILSDEMGLGKTITTIGLITSNKSTNTEYKTQNNKFKTNSTLIICPNHLAEQWANEIKKCSSLKYILCLSKPMHKKISHKDILHTDIVIVSYQFISSYKYYLRLFTNENLTLRRLTEDYYRELRNDDIKLRLDEINKLEIDKQLEEKDILFEHFEWYRVIVDEGHEIFGDMSNYSNLENIVLEKIFLSLTSKYRWYISGTPFINYSGFDKVMEFLQLETTIDNIKYSYNELLDGNKNMYKENLRKNILNNIYCRNTKESIINEYKMAKMIDDTIFLEFTNFEKEMYNNYKNDYKYTDLDLRQLCCHPLVLDRDNRVYETEGLSLEEVRQNLINYNKKKLDKEINKLKTYEELEYKGKIISTNKKINRLNYMINFFTNITPQLEKSENETCSICLNDFTNKIVTDCGHFFCKECIISSLNMSKKECPMCRDELNKTKIHPIINECKNSISELVAKYGTKMGKLIELCNNITKDSNNRIIIFSQWDKMIELIKKTLEENNIFSVSCKGNVHQRNKAIKTFKEGNNIKTIILSLKNAAAGINLIEATHIIMIDPIYGSKEEIRAIESQALGRVCRIGKNDDINIMRLIIKDTIEEKIYKDTIHNI